MTLTHILEVIQNHVNYFTFNSSKPPSVTGCTVAQHWCNDNQQSQWENGDFDTL